MAAGASGVWREWLAGLRLVRGDRLVATIFAVTALAGIAEGLIFVLIVPFVEEVLGGTAAEFGWLLAFRAAGALLGGLVVVGVVSRFVPAPRLVVAAGIADGLVLHALFQARSLPLAYALLALAGVAVVPFYVGQQTLLQRGVEDRFLGRVFGAYETTQALLMLLGMGLAAGLSGAVGVERLLELAGVAILVAALLAWAGLPGAVDSAAEAVDPA